MAEVTTQGSISLWRSSSKLSSLMLRWRFLGGSFRTGPPKNASSKVAPMGTRCPSAR